MRVNITFCSTVTAEIGDKFAALADDVSGLASAEEYAECYDAVFAAVLKIYPFAADCEIYHCTDTRGCDLLD